MQFALDAMGIQECSYIDIGAYHPFKLSNTAHFYRNGHRGINVEPNPALFSAFPKHRKRDINLNCGVLDQPGVLNFYALSLNTLSTFSKVEAEALLQNGHCSLIEMLQVPVRTVTEILDKHANRTHPLFMSIDVEGCEDGILRSIDFESWSPLVICCETLSYSTTGNGKKHSELIGFLQSRGYLLFADTYVNTVFVLEKAWRRHS